MANEIDKPVQDIQPATPVNPMPAKEPWAVQVQKPDETVYKLGVAPETKKQSFVEYVSSDPKTRQSLSEFISVNNQKAIEGAVPMDKLPGGTDFYKKSTGWTTSLYSPEKLAQIKAMPKIGMSEAFGMLNKWEMLPYLNGAALAEDVKVFTIMKRLKSSPDSVSAQDKDYAYKFLDEMAQLELRGLSFGGNMIYYGLRMPAYAIEFAGAVSAIGGLGTAAREATELTVKKGLKATVKEVAKGAVQAGGKGLLATVTPVAKFGALTVPNVAMLARPAKSFYQRRLNDSISITDKGEVLYKESTEKPALTMLKAFGDTWVENSSEMAGSFLFKPITGAVGRTLPKGFGVGFQKLVEKTTGLKYTKAVAQFGYDGILEEVGEERVGDFLRTALNLENKGYSFDAFGQALFPDWDKFQVELGLISIYGGTSVAMGHLATKLSTNKSPQEIEQIMKQVTSLSQKESETMVNQLTNIETEKDVQEYTQKIQDFKDMVGENVPRETLDANIAIWDNMINVLATKTGKTRSELADELPIVKSMKQGELQGLFQSDKISQVTKKAVSQFGTTQDFREAGYITADGVMLDFSAKKQGGDRGQRAIDHREVTNLFDSEKAITADQGMIDFMSQGNIRISAPDPSEVAVVHIQSMPTPSQIKTLSALFNKHNGNIDLELELSRESYLPKFFKEYNDGTKPQVILNAIKKHFSGEKPIESKVSQFRQGAKGAFNAKNNIIALFETADRSTFLHESAHAFFEMYLKHLPTELNTVMKWAGFEGKTIEDLTDKQYVKLQESFASGFELYLREGKAPSMKLADAFESFKDWLTKIYDSVQSLIQTSGINIKLNDDIKKFYDEMLAIPADRVAEIDTRTPEEIERDLTLFQNEKKKEAEKLFKEMPISEVFSGKIRLTPESKGLMDRYDVPSNLRTKSETAKTLDEWADTLKMSEEQVLEEVAKIGSKTKFINDYVEKAKEQAKYEKSFETKTASEIKSQGVSKAPISEDIYDKNYQLNSQELKFVDELKANAGEVGKAGAEWANRVFVPLSSRLKKISPKLQQLVRRFEYDTLQAQHKQAKQIFPFLEKYSSLEVKDARDLDFALKVSDITKINEIVERNGMKAEYDSVVKLLENIYDSARDAGLDFGFLIDYFPRKVENYEEFKTFLKGTNEWSAIEEALKQKAVDLQRPMTAEEQAEYVSGMLRGFGKGKILLSKPDNTEQRKIGEITPEMNAFYKDSSQALIEYVRSMTETIEARKLFGKSEKDIETSIGNVINQMIKAGELDRKDEVAAKKILTARFNQKGTTGIWAMYKTMNYLTLLGSPISAITQIEDIGLTMYRAGIFNTGKSLLNSIMNTPKVTLESIGVENIAEEFSEKTFGQKAIEKVFKITGFTWMDKLGKESFINGVYSKYEGLAKSNDSNFKDMLGQVFGEEADQVLNDIKTGNMSENVKYLLFNELAGIQPITLSEMPEYYVTGGNNRVFYALKTFTIKRFDYLRTHAIEQIQADPVKGIANLSRMVLFLMLAGASTDWIKDFLLGRKTPPEDYVVNNMFKVFGIQKYILYQARREGLMKAFSSQILPPWKLIDDISKDIMATTMNENPREIKDWDTWSNLPLFGKLYYWWFGRGSEKK